MISLRLALSSIPVTPNRRYRCLIPRPDINSRRRSIVPLRIIRTEVRIPFILMQPGVQSRSRSRRIQNRWRRVATVPMSITGLSQSRRIRMWRIRVQSSIHTRPFSALPNRTASWYVTRIKENILVQKLFLDLLHRNRQVSTDRFLSHIIILSHIRLYKKFRRIHHLLLIELASVVLMVGLHV